MKHPTFFPTPFPIFLCMVFLWLFSGHQALSAQQPFITVWKTDNPGSSNSTSIIIPANGLGYNYDIDWNNDGIYDEFGLTGARSHNYGTAGTYTVLIKGTFPGTHFASGSDARKLLQVVQWGDIVWTSMNNAFNGCSNMEVTATDMPNIGGVTDMTGAFRNCAKMTGPPNIGSWNVSGVTNMSFMFNGCSLFNQPIGNWNTAAVTNMGNTFSSASIFNQPIGNWNTAAVTNMSSMFSYCYSFDQPIGNWNTDAVTTMNAMFYASSAFNQPIGDWNTGALTSMGNMFSGATMFNQPLDNWNTGAVTYMLGMFSGATAFDQSLNNWNTAAVTNMSDMFYGATSFNQPLDNWNTAAVNSMTGMFSGATSFDQPIGNWNTAALINMNSMFRDATSFDQPIETWNTSSVTNMSTLFYNATAFNQPLDNWNTAAVTSMSGMFNDATAFNQPIGSWNTAAVTSMGNMFTGASSFNQSIGSWTLNASVNMSSMLVLSGMDCDHYSATLVGWAANPATPSGRSLSANGRQYGTSAVAARTYLDITKAWTIGGDTPSGTACSAALPVEWLDFAGEKQNNSTVLLQWTTAREQENRGFGVERSTDGVRWQNIGFVPAQSDNTGTQHYTFTDKTAAYGCPETCILYYRLRQTDLDGKENLSKIVSVYMTGSTEQAGIQVFPNPVSGNTLMLVLPETVQEPLTVRLQNAAGQVVRSGTFESGSHVWETGDLPSGMYTIIALGMRVPFIQKVIVQE